MFENANEGSDAVFGGGTAGTGRAGLNGIRALAVYVRRRDDIVVSRLTHSRRIFILRTGHHGRDLVGG